MSISNGVELEGEVGDIRATWRDESACFTRIQKYPIWENAWIGEFHAFREEATKICIYKCKVRDECLQDAMYDPEADGLRGGYWFDAGKLPVAVVREIRDTMNINIADHPTGRPKK